MRRIAVPSGSASLEYQSLGCLLDVKTYLKADKSIGSLDFYLYRVSVNDHLEVMELHGTALKVIKYDSILSTIAIPPLVTRCLTVSIGPLLVCLTRLANSGRTPEDPDFGSGSYDVSRAIASRGYLTQLVPCGT